MLVTGISVLKKKLPVYKAAFELYVRFLGNRITDKYLKKNRYEALLCLHKHLRNKTYRRLTRQIFNRNVENLKNKKQIRVCFIVFFDTTWSGKYLYEALEQDKRFLPFVLVEPRLQNEQVYLRTQKYYRDNGYRTYSYEEFREQHGKAFTSGNLADIVIHASLYEEYNEEVSIPKLLLASLHIVVPYSFWFDECSDLMYEKPYSQCIWKFYCPSYIHKKIGEKKCSIGKDNMIYSGYPKMDNFYELETNEESDIWNYADEKHKAVKIIYAPGYSSTDSYNQFSTFEFNYLWIYEYAKSHPDTTSWVYRPHPVLGQSLVESGVLRRIGEYRAYEKLWEELPNAHVISGGDYAQIFATSDGMILDSNSFVSGYQYVGKPLLFLNRGEARLNEYGKRILQVLYTADGDDVQKIKEFIEDVLLDGKDTMKEKRVGFFKKHLDYRKHNKGRNASRFIFDDIVNTIYR